MDMFGFIGTGRDRVGIDADKTRSDPHEPLCRCLFDNLPAGRDLYRLVPLFDVSSRLKPSSQPSMMDEQHRLAVWRSDEPRDSEVARVELRSRPHRATRSQRRQGDDMRVSVGSWCVTVYCCEEIGGTKHGSTLPRVFAYAYGVLSNPWNSAPSQ